MTFFGAVLIAFAAAACGRKWSILLQKSKVAGRLIFREITKLEAIADSYSVTHIREVACEFNVRRRGPPHLYTKIASAARRIFDHQCKTTFATQSGVKRKSEPGSEMTRLTHSDISRLSIDALRKGSLDGLVGIDERRDWRGQPQRLGGLEIDHQLEFRELLNPQVSWVLAFERG